MKIESVIVAEDGTKLLTPKDGFILVGSVYVSKIDDNGKPEGGLLGNGDCNNVSAYSVRDFIRALGIDPYELLQIAKSLMPAGRSNA
jgi:hypothetical protein